MKIVLPIDDEEYQYPYDVERICDVCAAAGYDITGRTAYRLWQKHSDNYAAGWLMLPESNQDLLEEILALGSVIDD